ncbi:MAG: hypothetical protein IPP63_19425 [Chloracidobacterium sp.]|nr:hypothetical protein [Chloracidobacterium sp.]
MISGTANVVNGSVATFLGSDRFTVDRLKARVIFTSNQVEIEEAAGYLAAAGLPAAAAERSMDLPFSGLDLRSMARM